MKPLDSLFQLPTVKRTLQFTSKSKLFSMAVSITYGKANNNILLIT